MDEIWILTIINFSSFEVSDAVVIEAQFVEWE